MRYKSYVKLCKILFFVYHIPFIWIFFYYHVPSVGWDYICKNWFLYPMMWLIGVCVFLLFHLIPIFGYGLELEEISLKNFWIEELKKCGFKKPKDNPADICVKKGRIEIRIVPRFQESDKKWCDVHVWIKHSQISKIYGWNARMDEYRQRLPYVMASGFSAFNKEDTFEAFEALSNLKRLPFYINNPIVKTFIKSFMELL